jgi:type I restriction enzyme R subunit
VDADLEKFYQCMRHLLRKLPVERDALPVEVTQASNMDSYRIQQTSSGEIKLLAEDGQLKPIGDIGTGKATEPDLAPLSEILRYINEHYGAEWTDADKVRHFADDMQRRLNASDGLRQALDPSINSSPATRFQAFEHFFNQTLEGMIDANFDLYRKIVEDPEFGPRFRDFVYREFARL